MSFLSCNFVQNYHEDFEPFKSHIYLQTLYFEASLSKATML